jgi:hypothetical protein
MSMDLVPNHYHILEVQIALPIDAYICAFPSNPHINLCNPLITNPVMELTDEGTWAGSTPDIYARNMPIPVPNRRKRPPIQVKRYQNHNRKSITYAGREKAYQ